MSKLTKERYKEIHNSAKQSDLMPSEVAFELLDEIDILRDALEDTMTWINGWSPNFTEDPEWPMFEREIKKLLND